MEQYSFGGVGCLFGKWRLARFVIRPLPTNSRTGTADRFEILATRFWRGVASRYFGHLDQHLFCNTAVFKFENRPVVFLIGIF